MMRLVLATIVLFFLPAQAVSQEDWQPFGIERFGFTFDVPPGFELAQRSEAGDGATFEGPEGATLAVWGVDLEGREFLTGIENQMREDENDGWRITYKRLTDDWASYSGIKDEQIRYARAIKVCGDRAAAFVIDYARSEKIPYDPIVTRMVDSLEPEGC